MLRETVQHCCTQTVYFKQLINNISFFSYPKLKIKKHFFNLVTRIKEELSHHNVILSCCTEIMYYLFILSVHTVIIQ